jgi:HemY protein
MIRIVFFLVLIGILALGVAWFADRPGDVVITWQGWRIETSLMVLAAAVVATMAALALVWSILRAVLSSPFQLRRHLHRRRGERAYEAISSGLIALGAGDLMQARKYTAEADRIAPSEPLALLLRAQAAQLAGDRNAADAAFRELASRPDTKALGLHGLFVEAGRRGDDASAQALAEEAARTSPALGWAAKAVLEFRCATGDWTGALALLEAGKSALDKETYRRQRAVMLTARALATAESDRDSAKALALEAVKLEPTLVPAASLAGRMLAEAGDLRRATRIVTKAWRANPHPDLAQVFSDLRFGDTARDRLKRVETLARAVPGHIEGALALARAAIDAQQFQKARAALAVHLGAPTKRVALLMAELERVEHNDEGRAREWIARAFSAAPDPTWTAGGHVSDRWLPALPNGQLDAFEWRVPMTGPVNLRPAIQPELIPPSPAEPVAVEAESTPAQAAEARGESGATSADAAEPAKPAEQASSAAPPKPAELEKPVEPTRTRARAPIANPRSQPVLPLIHAPDDPGPDAAEEAEPQPAETQNSGWRKLFH